MLDHELGTPEVAHKRGARGIVHRVGEIAHEPHVEAEAYELPHAVTTAEHAHIQVDAAYEHSAHPPLLQQVVQLLAALGNGVAIEDADGLVLSRPHHAVDRGGPGVAVAATICVVDRQRWLISGRPAPRRAEALVGRERHWRHGGGRRLRQRARWRAIVVGHAVCRRVDDEHARIARAASGAIDGRRELSDAGRSGRAPVPIPHIADQKASVGHGLGGHGLL